MFLSFPLVSSLFDTLDDEIASFDDVDEDDDDRGVFFSSSVFFGEVVVVVPAEGDDGFEVVVVVVTSDTVSVAGEDVVILTSPSSSSFMVVVVVVVVGDVFGDAANFDDDVLVAVGLADLPAALGDEDCPIPAAGATAAVGMVVLVLVVEGTVMED